MIWKSLYSLLQYTSSNIKSNTYYDIKHALTLFDYSNTVSDEYAYILSTCEASNWILKNECQSMINSQSIFN